MDTIPAVGTVVRFREDTPQYPANKNIRYIVRLSPLGDTVSHDADGGPYVWLADERDADKAPSRQRRRTGYVASLELVREEQR